MITLHVPAWAGKIISLTPVNGMVYVTCEYGIFMLSESTGGLILTPIHFSD